MRTLGATLTTAQKARQRYPYLRLTFSKAGETNIVIEQDRILLSSGEDTTDSQKATMLFDNSTGYFTALNLKGWQVVIERGLKNAAGTVEYDTMPPMKVMSQHLDSRPGVLRCTMSFIGIPDLLSLDKASKDYFNHWSNTKTVKALITEIADGNAVDTELTEEQTINDAFSHVYGASHGYAGAALTITNRTITKLGFLIKKVGSPTGTTVTFRIDQDDGGSTLASATFPIASITTGLTWCEATLASPVLVNERVWLAVVYTGGDSSNYIGVAYNTTVVKLNEALVLQGTGSPTEDWEDAGQDCAYRYKYTAGTGTGVTNGVPCFQHCHDAGLAYEVVYDSEDSLIGTYAPADGFQIAEGSSRLEAINTLLRFTGCVKIIKADGKIHVFVPTIAGTTYAYQYQLGLGNHEFFSKSIRNSLVVPNKIHVHSYDDDGVLVYDGSATDSASYAIIPIEDFIKAKCTSLSQANSIAAAMIAQLMRNGQQGSATIPLNLGAEIYDYVLVTDSRESDTRIGNLGHIRWWYIPGKDFNMTFSFGDYVSNAIGGPPTTPRYKLGIQNFTDVQDAVTQQEDQNYLVEGALKDIYKKLPVKTEPSTITDAAIAAQIAASTDGFISSVVQDTTPQLGGDLDLNGHNIDFPTTANISDCLDEDNMASDSATKLATQQSIKAYVDTHGLDVTQYDAIGLTEGTDYQNGAHTIILIAQVSVSGVAGGTVGQVVIEIAASAPANIQVGICACGQPAAGTQSIGGNVIAVVPPFWYYRIQGTNTYAINSIRRFTLG